MRPRPEGVERVAQFLNEARAEARLEEFRAPTPTAEDAARAVGCRPEQIVKSLLFLCDERPVLVLVPGSRRADPRKVATAVGATTARIATPKVVRATTGFEVGGVAPFPLPGVGTVLIDQTLLALEVLWVGAGSDRHLAGLSPTELLRLSRGRSVDACAES